MVPWILLVFALFTVLMKASRILSVLLFVCLPPVCAKLRLAEDGGWEAVGGSGGDRGKRPFRPAVLRVLLSQRLVSSVT